METANHRNILIADKQFLIFEALTSMLGAGNCTRSTMPSYIENVIENGNFNLLIIDPDYFPSDPFLQIEKIKSKWTDLPIMVLANKLTKTDFDLLNRAGVKSILLKTASRDEILTGIDSALKGKKYFSSDVLDVVFNDDGNPVIEAEARLTASEIEVVRLISSGLTTKEIAARRNISFHTANTHRKNIFRKMGVNNTSELIIKSIRAGYIDNIEYYI
jgi:DNA-binding NarL/FixJ family response regulator